jgi:hypothetical protein
MAQTNWGSRPAASSNAARPAAQATVKDIEALQKAVTDAWEKMPLTQRRAIFVVESPPLYGAYVERPSNVFKPGEKLVTYVEPVGYTWTSNGEMYDFGVSVDFTVKTAEGKILGGQEKFGNFVKTSRAKVQEFMVVLTVSLDGAPPGKYVLEYKLHDNGSDKVSSFSQPFTIAQ